ncbi:MAG: acyltransferase family protein [Prevotella sp.]
MTRQESSAMRGIAILAIMLHNYTHWLGPMVKENEYTFDHNNVRRLLAELSSPTTDLLPHLLSFFGHYGVPVFVALSAYGLFRKYETGGAESRVTTFIANHWRKLFLMMAIGYTAFVLVDYMTPGHYHYRFSNVVGQLLMVSNFYPDPDHAIWPGPYWYFGLMMQLYVFYRFVMHDGKMSLRTLLPHRLWTLLMVSMALVTLLLQLAFDPMGDDLNWYRYNMFGALPVFIVAMLGARWVDTAPSRRKWEHGLMALVSSALVVLGSLSFSTWILVPFLVCVATYSLVKAVPLWLLRPLEWVGTISAAIFVCHPITRKVLIPISRHDDLYAGLLLYVVATLFLAMLFHRMISSLTGR